MIKGEHMYVYFVYVLSYGTDPISPRHFDVRGDKKARINGLKVGSPA